MKRDKESTKRQQERVFPASGIVNRIVEFAELSNAQDHALISGIATGNSASAYTGAKNSLTIFLPADQTAKSLDDRLKIYIQEQSCIDKLVLACFCLNLPLQKTLFAMALLLSKRIPSAPIAEVATILDQKLATYRRRSSQNSRNLESLRASAPDIKRPKVYPDTLVELEKGLDD